MLFPLVMKFGGAGLADGPAVERACSVVAAHGDQHPIVVVSAHAGVTESLERCARKAEAGHFDVEEVRIRHKSLLRQLSLDSELLDRLLAELSQILYSISGRGCIQAEELDFVLSLGERMSTRVVAAALRSRGLEATPVDAFDLGLTTDSCHGQARPLPGVEASLRRSLGDIPGIPVITGFLAKDGGGNLTTMGRNGSDLTASLVAQAVGARNLIFWKTVPGLMSADPELVPEARVIGGLSLAEAAEIAFHGASVLHPTAIEPLRGREVVLHVRDLRAVGLAGSRLDGRDVSEVPLAVAGNRELAGLRVESDNGGLPPSLFALMHAHHVRPRFLQPSTRDLTLYAPPSAGFDILKRELAERAEALPTLSSVVLVGGKSEARGRRAFELLRKASLEPRMSQLDREGLSQVFLFDRRQRTEATRLLHGLLQPAIPVRRSRSST